MSEAVVDDIVAVLPPLLQTLESLTFVARNLNPPDFDRVMQIAGEPEEALQAVRPRLADWPEKFAHIKTALDAAIEPAPAAYAGPRAVQNGEGDLVGGFLRPAHLPSSSCTYRPPRSRCRSCRAAATSPGPPARRRR